MFQRFALEFLLFIAVFIGIYFVYIKLIHSRLFGRVVEAAKPGPETAEDVLDQLDRAEVDASRTLVSEEAAAVTKARNATTIRKRLKKDAPKD